MTAWSEINFLSSFFPLCLWQVFAIQHVDVCMFNNGKFKNIVADVDQADQAVGPGASLNTSYKLLPKRGEDWKEPFVFFFVSATQSQFLSFLRLFLSGIHGSVALLLFASRACIC